jgi:hypothetical protein
VAAARDNGVCGVGVAYDSKIAGDFARVTGCYVVYFVETMSGLTLVIAMLCFGSGVLRLVA